MTMMMMMMRLLLVGLTALAVLVGDRVLANHVGTYRVVCYFTNWSQYRPSPATFQPENIDPSLCTHIVFAFAVLNKRLQLIPHEWNDPDLYKRTFHTLNRTMNRPKLLLAVGGYKHGPVLLSKMAGNVYKRSQFINQTVPYLRRYNFDGIELDWEFPGEINRGGRAVDKKNFPLMLEELRRAFDAESAVTKRPRLLLTAAVAASSDLIDGGYDVKAIGSIVDYVTLMSYDYFGAWNNVAGHNAPLYEGYNQTAKYNVKWSVRKWLHEGMPQDKFVVGLSLYGRCSQLEAAEKPAVGAKLRRGAKACKPGTYTREAGVLAYYEVCQKMQDQAYKIRFDPVQDVPYMSKGDDWISYDNERSLHDKVMYMKERRLGGVMIYTLDFDDFSGKFCEAGPHPLLRAIRTTLEQPDPPLVRDWIGSDPSANSVSARSATAAVVTLVFLTASVFLLA